MSYMSFTINFTCYSDGESDVIQVDEGVEPKLYRRVIRTPNGECTKYISELHSFMCKFERTRLTK